MRKRVLGIIICFIILLPVYLSAQTAAELEIVLETASLTYAQAAMFVHASSGASIGVDSADNSFDLAVINGWFSGKTKPDQHITLGKLSFLMMKAFKMKGGLMYTIFPSPRYAYRSMVNRNLIQGTSDPSMKVSGSRFLLILGKVLSTQGDET